MAWPVNGASDCCGIAEEAGDGHRGGIEATATQLEEVRRRLVGCNLVGGGVHVVAERQKGDLGDAQPVVVSQAGNQRFIRHLWFLKHRDRAPMVRCGVSWQVACCVSI